MSTEAALFDAIERHDAWRVRALLAEGADPNALQTDWPHYRALHAAVEELEHGGALSVIVLLLLAGARVDERDGRGDATPLLMAISRGAAQAARLFLAAGADPNVVGAEGDCPLRWATEHGDLGLVEELLLCDASRTIDHAGGAAGLTALGLAAKQLNAALVKLLLAGGADPGARDADRLTANDRLPPRDATNGVRWDEVSALLEAASLQRRMQDESSRRPPGFHRT